MDIRFDAICIETGVLLFAKAHVCKEFHIHFKVSRLYGKLEMVAVEPFRIKSVTRKMQPLILIGLHFCSFVSFVSIQLNLIG